MTIVLFLEIFPQVRKNLDFSTCQPARPSLGRRGSLTSSTRASTCATSRACSTRPATTWTSSSSAGERRTSPGTSGRRSPSTARSTPPSSAGGTLFEAVVVRGKLDEYRRGLVENRFSHVEVSDGTIDLPRERKLELIAELAKDFVVMSEGGSKAAEGGFRPH